MVVYPVIFKYENALEEIFSTKDKAEAWVAREDYPEDYIILEYLVDDGEL